jgi:hypothetical protein
MYVCMYGMYRKHIHTYTIVSSLLDWLQFGDTAGKFQLPALPSRHSDRSDCVLTRCVIVGVLLATVERRAAEVHSRWALIQ